MTTHLARIEGQDRAFCGKTKQHDGITIVDALSETDCGACIRFANHWNADRPLPRQSYHSPPPA